MDKMPEEYKSKVYFNPNNNSYSRIWSDEEINFLKDMRNKGYSFKEISESMDRNLHSVKMKWKRLTQKDGTYNKSHIKQKRMYNRMFLEQIKPKSICDVFSGGGGKKNIL